VLSIEVLHVTLAEVAHQPGACFGPRRGQEQMHVVCHEAVCVHRTVVLIGQLAQVRQVNKVITVATKAGIAVVTALNDMHGHSGQDQTQRSRHGRN
jgi:hypothetical protein